MNFLFLAPLALCFSAEPEAPINQELFVYFEEQKKEGLNLNWPRPNSGEFQFSTGFTADPSTFMIGFEYVNYLSDRITMGPLVQLGVTDNRTLFAPTLNFRYWLDIPEADQRFHPYLQGGFGFAYMNHDGRAGADNDLGVLFNLGFGGEVELKNGISLGSNILFNVMPQEVLGEHSFFTWQLITVSFRF